MIKDYIIKQTLGKGAYGIVYKVQKKDTNNIYVIKQIPLAGLTSAEKEEVEQEAKILSSINSDFVVKYYDSFKEKNNINIVMEYCDGGDLNDFIIKKKNNGKLLEENLIWKIFIKITIGLSDIHRMKILHRDLKTLNIFLKKDLDIKIGDLGVAKVLSKNSFAKTVIGTPYYLSPEICQEIPYNDKSDVWALGCILYELCTFKHPFDAKSQGALILKILNNKPEPINDSYSIDLNNLIFMLLDKNCDKRPSCVDILKNKMVINKIKSIGLYDYIIKIDNGGNNQNNQNNKVKISKKNLEFTNINKKSYNNQNIKENIHNNGNNTKNIIKSNNKKQISSINLLDNIKNNNLNFNNINKQLINKRKKSEIKINVIKIGDINNGKQPTVDNNNNKEKLIKYNNFFINKSINETKNKKINEEKNVILKKYAKFYNKEKSDIIGRKIGRIQPVQIIFKNSNEIKSNNFIKPQKKIIINNNNNINNINKIYKYNNGKIKIKNDLNEEKNIKINNLQKNISKKESNKIPIKIIPDNSLRFEKKENDGNNSIIKSAINHNYIKNKISIKKDNTPQANKNRKLDIIISNKKNKLISILPKKNKSNNNIDIKIVNNIEIKNDSFPSNNDINLSNEKNISSNFQIINNNLPNNNSNNEYIVNTNECEDSIDDNIKKINKRSQSYFNPRINKEKNIIDSDRENSDDFNDDEDENVKEIKEFHNQENLKNTYRKQLQNKKDLINNDINILKDKIQKCKSEILQLIGENDYKYIMNLYNIDIKEKNKIDEIYEKIEDFANKNYSPGKKEKFNDCYFRLVSIDYQLGKKNEEFDYLY